MSLSAAEILALQRLEPNWRPVWDRLCVTLLGSTDEPGRLVRTVNSLAIVWPSGIEDRDDFISHMMASYHRRAVKGTLLARYDTARGDVAAFLCSRKTLRKAALRFLEKRAIWQSYDDVSNESGRDGIFPPIGDLDRVSDKRDALVAVAQLLKDDPWQVAVREGQKPNRVEQQAGMQLHSRIAWGEPRYESLREHLTDVVRPQPADSDPFHTLATTHRAAVQEIGSQIERVSKRIWNKGRFVSQAVRRRLDRRFGKLLFEKEFQPLRVPKLVDLLGITSLLAAQHRRRYREALPSLLPQFQASYRAIGEHPESPPRRKRRES